MIMRSSFSDPEQQFKAVYGSAWQSMHLRFTWCMATNPIRNGYIKILDDVLGHH